jgi:hypothetical protein
MTISSSSASSTTISRTCTQGQLRIVSDFSVVSELRVVSESRVVSEPKVVGERRLVIMRWNDLENLHASNQGFISQNVFINQF